ncbi:MAG: sensor histidine kinase [Terracidiphilus sp.]
MEERTVELAATVEELRAKNAEVEALAARVSSDLREKEVLLREVFHRVKNNLQVVQSLLRMSARTIESSVAREAIEMAVQRVRVMAMVHEHLYQMPNLASLSVPKYLRDVVEGAIASSSSEQDRVELQFEVGDMRMPLDLAIPLGLLANELVSNCLKHGIPQGQRGRICFIAESTPGGISLSVQDNGKGLAEDFDASKCKSMGLKLAASLAHQLGGKLAFSSNEGCRVEANLTRFSSCYACAESSDKSLISEQDSQTEGPAALRCAIG